MTTLGPSVDDPGAIRGRPWGHPWTTLGPSVDDPGAIRGRPWGHPWTTLGPSVDDPGVALTCITATGGTSNTGVVTNMGGKDSACKQRRSDLDHLHNFSQCHLAKRCRCPNSQRCVPWTLWPSTGTQVWTIGNCLCSTTGMSTTLTVNCNSGISTGFCTVQRPAYHKLCPRSAIVESSRASGQLPCGYLVPKSELWNLHGVLLHDRTMGTCRCTTTGMSSNLVQDMQLWNLYGVPHCLPCGHLPQSRDRHCRCWEDCWRRCSCGNRRRVSNGGCWSHVLDNERGMCIRDRGSLRSSLSRVSLSLDVVVVEEDIG